MKIKFEDGSFIECNKSEDKIIISIQVINFNDKLKKITNTVELTKEQLEELIKDEN
jgi:hypothetical protein